MCTESSIGPTVRARYTSPISIRSTDNLCVTGSNIAGERKSESYFSGQNRRGQDTFSQEELPPRSHHSRNAM